MTLGSKSEKDAVHWVGEAIFSVTAQIWPLISQIKKCLDFTQVKLKYQNSKNLHLT